MSETAAGLPAVTRGAGASPSPKEGGAEAASSFQTEAPGGWTIHTTGGPPTLRSSRPMELPESLATSRGLWRWCPAARCALALALCALALAAVALAVALARQAPAPPVPQGMLSELPVRPDQQQQQQQQQQQYYAQLVVDLHGNSSIVTRKLDWHTPPVRGASLNGGFVYNKKSQMLMVEVDGLYCVYAQMNLTYHGNITEKMNANLTIYHTSASSSNSVHMLLNLPLRHFHDPCRTRAYFTAVLHRLAKNDTLFVKINADSGQTGHLEPHDSFFGLFRIHET